MQLITTDINIFKDTNIYLLLYSYIKEEEDKVTIYARSSEIKDELIAKYSDVINEYYKDKSVTLIYDPSVFADKDEEDEDLKVKAENIPQKKGILKGNIIAIALGAEPFFISKGINDIAWGCAEKTINNDRHTIFFLYGPSSTGKSHLVSKIAVSLCEKGKNVYIANGDSFIDEIFATFKNNENFFELHSNIDCFIIDDIQTLNRNHLSSVMDCVFSIMNRIAECGGKFIATCDQHPYALNFFPDRIITRLMSDYITDINLPDENIKEQFIEYNFKKLELLDKFESDKDREDIKKLIIINSPQLRIARGLIGLCDIIAYQDPPLTSSKFFAYMSKQSSSSDLNPKIRLLRELLANYFGEVIDTTVDKKPGGKRIRRKTILSDSLCYYLLQNSIPLRVLQKDLNVIVNHHKYFLEKGKQIYESVKNDESLMMQIRMILQGTN